MKKIESRKIKAGVVITAVLLIAMSSVSALVANSDETIIANSDNPVGGLPRDDPYIDCVNVTLNATDTWSGVNYTMYRLQWSGSQSQPPWQIYTGTFTVEGDENYTLYFYSVDNAGNVEDVNIVLFNITSDNIAPVTTCILEGETSYPSP